MPHILFIDAYDSFSNNIVSLLQARLFATVEVVKIDDHRFIFNDVAFHNFLRGFNAVVAGPGPGNPANVADIGLMGKLWRLPDDRLLPVLGICLGFQSLGLAFGARVERLREPRHGLITPIIHCGEDMFEGMNGLMATQYHSLQVHLNHLDKRGSCPPSLTSEELLPLAWDLSDDVNGPILMAARHCHKPFWGVQYHPESICTNAEGQEIVDSWWREASAWHLATSASTPSTASSASGPSTPVETETCVHLLHTEPQVQLPDIKLPFDGVSHVDRHIASIDDLAPPVARVHWRTMMASENLLTLDIVETITSGSGPEPVVLESGVRNGKPLNSETGRFSIIGVRDFTETQIRYCTHGHQLTVSDKSRSKTIPNTNIHSVLEYLDTFMEPRRACDGPDDVPFWGGLIGYLSYEAALETIDVRPLKSEEQRPDLWFVFVERSIVIDHLANKIYIQSIRDADENWLSSVEEKMLHLANRPRKSYSAPIIRSKQKDRKVVATPNVTEYCQKVRDCQSHIRAGSAYELCLTDQTLVHSSQPPWELYKELRIANPAPFGTYFSLKAEDEMGVDVVGSSPERFLSWSRCGTHQFRPIKGTVKKTATMTRTKAEKLLSCDKERAENLMIVDLIRHDLNGVPGVRDVRVPKLMSVEEYETVFQLVSVIEGDVDARRRSTSALGRSLPPGSMTGAPKKRSCELLNEIEHGHPRGLYSGVLGYFDVGGGGDFAVVIRTAFKWNNEDVWRIGAGGAVTTLSRPVEEWEEMLTKRERLLGLFCLSGKTERT